MTIPADMKFTRLANWFGSDVEVRDLIAKRLAGRPMVVIPFAGGMSILPALDAAKIIANDLHSHVINMAGVMQDAVQGPKLYRALRRRVFHPDELAQAQQYCSAVDSDNDSGSALFVPLMTSKVSRDPFEWALMYFIATWMDRGGSSCTDGEFGGALPVRYSPNGGGSGQRFHNAVTSIPAWRRLMRRCEFTCEDWAACLARVHDSTRVGIYIDAPWPDQGDGYKHKFTSHDQHLLAEDLSAYEKTLVVIRYGDHPLIRDLYPEDRWHWTVRASRTQANESIPEVLITNRSAGGAQ